jgi:hypothetical protein
MPLHREKTGTDRDSEPVDLFLIEDMNFPKGAHAIAGA